MEQTELHLASCICGNMQGMQTWGHYEYSIREYWSGLAWYANIMLPAYYAYNHTGIFFAHT